MQVPFDHNHNQSLPPQAGQGKLFVGQVPAVCTEEMLLPLFSTYGTIVEIKIMRDHQNRSKGCAWVRFQTAAMAQLAIDALNEKHTIPPQTNALKVQFAQTKAVTPTPPQQQQMPPSMMAPLPHGQFPSFAAPPPPPQQFQVSSLPPPPPPGGKHIGNYYAPPPQQQQGSGGAAAFPYSTTTHQHVSHPHGGSMHHHPPQHQPNINQHHSGGGAPHQARYSSNSATGAGGFQLGGRGRGYSGAPHTAAGGTTPHHHAHHHHHHSSSHQAGGGGSGYNNNNNYGGGWHAPK